MTDETHSEERPRRRVLLATLADLEHPGGVPRSVHMLRDGLRGRGHTVDVVSHPIAAGVRNTVARRIWRRLSRSTEEFVRIRRALARISASVGTRDVDVCIATDAWTARACALAGRTTVFRMAGDGSITDEWVRNGFVAAGSPVVRTLRVWEEEGSRAAAQCIVLGESGRRALLDAGIDAGCVTIISNAVALPARERVAATGDELRVVAVGNLRPVKGADVLAEAVARLPEALRARVRLTHLGDGNDESNPTFAKAKSVLEGAGVTFRFGGAVSHDAVVDELAASDVFVFPSRVESFGNALVEAIAAGLPVVATDVGAVRHILGPDAAAAGLVVPPDDPPAFADALASLLHSEEMRADWGVRNARRAAAEFSMDAMLRRYERVIERALTK